MNPFVHFLYAAELTIDPNNKLILSGGPLHTAYEFSQLHFHWGDNDNIGSERAVRGKKYPIELHVVTFKQDYGDIASAMNYPDGICALSCLFEVEQNFILAKLLKNFFLSSNTMIMKILVQLQRPLVKSLNRKLLQKSVTIRLF